MGVDAEMVVRIPFQPNEQLQACVPEWAYRLAEAIGPEHFFFDDDEALARLDKGKAPRRALNLWLPGNEDEDEDGYELRGVKPEPGYSYLWLSLSGRYYGPGYERGDPWVYVAVAEWLERNIHEAVVYYGGDSSDQIEPFDKADRERMIEHWAKSGGIPYRGMFSDAIGQRGPTCPLCGFAATQFGSGGGYASWTCLGCLRHWVWVEGYDKPRAYPMSRWGREFDSFKAADEMRSELANRTKARP